MTEAELRHCSGASSAGSQGTPVTQLDFRPLPLLGNPHVQTVLGFFWRGPRVTQPTHQHMLRLADGDSVVLHDTVPRTWVPGQRMALLLHGLGGCAQSHQTQRLAVRLFQQGVRVIRLDQRGVGHGVPLARNCFHAGRSDDVRAVLGELHRWSPTSPLILMGTSLGGNLALKLAGEAADQPVSGLERVITLAPPIDLELCAARISQRRNRTYELNYLRRLLATARRHHRHFPDLPPPRFPRRLTLRIFDDLYTAPRSGFADALDYYRKASSWRLIERIAVPTLILTARDDPFIAVEPFEQLRVPRHITIRILNHGGHVGFIGRDGAGGFRWAEQRMVEWALAPMSPAGSGG